MLVKRQLADIMAGLWNLIQVFPLKDRTCTEDPIMERLKVTVDMSRLMLTDTELRFSLAGPSDVTQVVDFFMENFWPDYPLTEITGMDIDAEISSWFQEFIHSAIAGGLSLIVRNEENMIVGATINQVYHRQPVAGFRSFASFANSQTRPIWTKMSRLVDDLHENVHFDQEPVLSIDLIAVRKDYRNRGIAVQMVGKTLEIARVSDVRIVKTESMDLHLTKGLTNKMGFVVAKKINYNDYFQNGEKPFRTNGFQNNAWLLVKHL